MVFCWDSKRNLRIGLLLLAVGVSMPVMRSPAQEGETTIEIIGLHRWTRQMVKDSLAKHVPGSDTTLSTHACGAEMLQLGFIRTAAINYPGYTIVSVVEPQDSARVKTNPPITTTHAMPEAWSKVLAPHLGPDGTLTNGLLGFSIKYYDLIRAGKRDSVVTVLRGAGMPIPPLLDSLWTFFSKATTEKDFQQAVEILKNDSSVAKRMFAIGVLANFPDKDEAWHVLVHTFRDENSVPGPWLQAQDVLTGWVNRFVRPVDWSPAQDDVRALLAGTNLWVLPSVLRILSETKLDPKLASPVLKGNGVFVLGYAASQVPAASGAARKLLSRMSGLAEQADLAAFTQWVEKL